MVRWLEQFVFGWVDGCTCLQLESHVVSTVAVLSGAVCCIQALLACCHDMKTAGCVLQLSRLSSHTACMQRGVMCTLLQGMQCAWDAL